MNEIIMKTLLAKAEEKGNAPVTNALNYMHSTSRRGLYAPNYVKKGRHRLPRLFLRLSHHLPATSGTGWNYVRTRGNAIISIS